MSDSSLESRNADESADTDWYGIMSKLAILGGVLLLVASVLPWGGLAQEALWTSDDSQTFADISAEYHRLSTQKPQQAGLTAEELDAQRSKAKAHFEAMQAKLDGARERPVSWKRYLLWAGILLASGGVWARVASLQR